MSCLARESRESKTFSSFLAMLTQSGLCVPRVRGFQRRLRGELRWLDNYRRWWRFNSRLGGLIPALCIEVQAILLKPPPGDSTGAIALLGSLRGSLRASTIRRQMTAVGASHLFPSVLAKVRKLNRDVWTGCRSQVRTCCRKTLICIRPVDRRVGRGLHGSTHAPLISLAGRLSSNQSVHQIQGASIDPFHAVPQSRARSRRRLACGGLEVGIERLVVA